MKPYQLFNKYFKEKNLKKTYTEKVINSGAIGIDKINHQNFQKNLQDNLQIINRKVDNGSYSFTTFKEKLISKGANKNPRVISIPTIRDRITLRAICDILFNIYSSEIKIGIPQVTISNIQEEINKEYYDAFLKIDIQSFYSSINHELLMKMLKKKIHKKEFINLIEKAIKNGTVGSPIKGEIYKNEVGVPQGLSISNILAEIFMLELDKELASEINLKYYRYVDDILILCNYNDVKNISDNVISKLLHIGLTAHPIEENSKSQFGYLSEHFYFLGYYFSNYSTSVGNKTIHKFEASIVRLLTTYKYRDNYAKNDEEKNKNLSILEWRINLRITGCIFNDTKRGWIFYYSQITNLQALYKLDKSIEKLLKRFGLDGKTQVKKLVKSYFEAKKKDITNNKYIVNFDELTKSEKIEILKKYLGERYNLKSKSKAEIDRLFNTKISRVIKELEEDLQDFS